MPYNPSEQFDHRQIFAGIAGAGQSIGGDIAEEKKKRAKLEQQNAFNQAMFPKVSSVLSEEEKQQFLKGNINAQNGIMTAAGARMMEKFEDQKAQEARQRWEMEQTLKLKIAQMQHAPKPLQPPMTDPGSGMIWNGRQWVRPGGAAAGQPKGLIAKSGLSVTDLDAPNLIKYYKKGADDKTLGPPVSTAEAEKLQDGVVAVAPGGKPVPYPQWKAAADSFRKAHGQLRGDAPAEAPAAPALASKDQQALAWAQANPNDPRAVAILKKLGQ